MFEKISAWIKRILGSAFDTGTDKKPEVITSLEMEVAISRWARAYEGHPPWANKNVSTLGLPASIAAEVARMAAMEAEITITGSQKADWLNTQFKSLRENLQVLIELAAALGGAVLKPYAADDRIVIDIVHGDCFFPTVFDSSGRMTGAIFVEQIRRPKGIYTRLEKHDFVSGTHTIRNKAFSSSNMEGLGKEIPLNSVSEWADIGEEVTINDVDRPLFGYLRMPFANRIDRHSPLGVSIFAGAESLIKNLDEQYSRYLWEYEGSELAIDAAVDFLNDAADGTKRLPKTKERLFRALTPRDGNFYQVFSPDIRDESIKRGINTMMQRIEFACGLAYGTLSDPQAVEKTAEEIRTAKQRSYHTISGIQRATTAAINDLVYAMDKLSATYNLGGTDGKYELVCAWDDSITNDPQVRKQAISALVMAGKYPTWRYLVDFEGYSEQEAKAIQAETAQAMGDPYVKPGIS